MPMSYFLRSLMIPVSSSLRGKKSGTLMNESSKYSLLNDDHMVVPVPKGCLAVYVGEDMRRFVIPTSYLCLPVFRELMEKVAEEFGFDQAGGLRIPCEEEDFEELLKVLEMETRPLKTKKKSMKD